MAVMATDQPSTSGTEGRAVSNGTSPTDEGGFTTEWSQTAEQRVAARRNRIQATANENMSNPQPQAITAEEVEDDDEESRFFSINKSFYNEMLLVNIFLFMSKGESNLD